MENDGLGRKLQVLREEISANREDMESLTLQLTNKMKEAGEVSKKAQEQKDELSRLRHEKENLMKEQIHGQAVSSELHNLKAKVRGRKGGNMRGG